MAQHFRTAFVLISVILIFSCAKPPGSTGETASDTTQISITDNTPATELLSSAEQLINPYSFMLAYRLASMAVEREPENIKAQFYVALLKRFEVFRGLATRIKPMLSPADRREIDRQLQLMPDSPLKSFLTAEGELLTTVSDVQQVIQNYLQEVKNFRDFLKRNESVEMNISYNQGALLQPFRVESANSCTVNESEGSLDIRCSSVNNSTVRLNIADMIALRQITAGELLQGIISNSYSLEGLLNLKDQDMSGMSPEQKLNAVFSQAEVGRLRSDHMLSLVQGMGSDLSTAVKWAMDHQESLCLPGRDARSGYLFKNGFCVQNVSESRQLLDLFDRALNGVIELDTVESRPKVDILALVRNPIQDLRSVRPTQFDACSQPTSLADNSLNGVFPDRNAVELLSAPCLD